MLIGWHAIRPTFPIKLKRAALLGLGAAACYGEASPLRTTRAASDTSARVVAAQPSSQAVLDQDNDSVPDSADRCPTEAGPQPGGCPTAAAPTGVVVENVGSGPTIPAPHFAAGSSALSGDDLLRLDAVAALLKQHPEILLLEVHGHADNMETEPLLLSRRRAETVVTELAKRGVAANRLLAIAEGSRLARESNGTAEGRAQNRRIEFRVARGRER